MLFSWSFYIFLELTIFQQTVNDLFAEPSGLQSLVEDKEKEKLEKEKAREEKEKEMALEREKEKEKAGSTGKAEKSEKDSVTMTQFEQVWYVYEF